MQQPAVHHAAPPENECGPADFLNHPPELDASVTPDFDRASPARFINRELSWLAFDDRVLDEAENHRHPLLERVRFLAISGANLDEFYTVRVAGLLGLARSGHEHLSADGLSVQDQLLEISIQARLLEAQQQRIWSQLHTELRACSIYVLEMDEVTAAESTWLDTYFVEQILPLLTPLAVDPAHPFPFIPNQGLVLAMQLVSRTADADADHGRLDALLQIPHAVDRFIHLPAGNDDSPPAVRLLRVESLILSFVDRLFPGYDTIGAGLFRVLRDSDIEIEEEAEDLVREFETALKRRRRGDVIRLSVEAPAPEELKVKIAGELGVLREDMHEAEGMIRIRDLAKLVDLAEHLELAWPSYMPRMPERVRDHNGDIFSAIRQKDMLLHHPYESFETVVNFLRQAARDCDVVAIKQTLYRTVESGPVVEALCEAAESGISVTAVVEIKARFDEAANIRLARRLERAGVQVVFGFLEWKTHAKISLVVRREGGKLVSYTHFGTGNYHPATARVYTDLSLFSCDQVLGNDATRIFNYITGYALPQNMERVAVAPVGMKAKLLTHIEEEIAHARAGRPAVVWAKLNSLIHPEMIDALYAASQAGVRVDLVVRGICGLRPGVSGLSENIRVKSVVGRFLEHSRIVCFGNGDGLPSSAARVYISSADWMDRNLDRRIETLVEIVNPTVKAQIVDQVMAANLRDEAQSWLLQPGGEFVRFADTVEAQGREDLFNCHEFFMTNPSLSGRGRSGTDDAPRLTLVEGVGE